MLWPCPRPRSLPVLVFAQVGAGVVCCVCEPRFHVCLVRMSVLGMCVVCVRVLVSRVYRST